MEFSNNDQAERQRPSIAPARADSLVSRTLGTWTMDLPGIEVTGEPRKSTALSNYILSGQAIIHGCITNKKFLPRDLWLGQERVINNETNWPRPLGDSIAVCPSNLHYFLLHRRNVIIGAKPKGNDTVLRYLMHHNSVTQF